MLIMIIRLRYLCGWLRSAFSAREHLILENLALRQQLLALHAKRPRRRLTVSHKMFWVMLRKFWSGWKNPLILVTPRTVVGWHRAGFRLYWKWISRAGSTGGRKRIGEEIRTLIFRMVAENPTGPPFGGWQLRRGQCSQVGRPHPSGHSRFETAGAPW
jgi:putative transposase